MPVAVDTTASAIHEGALERPFVGPGIPVWGVAGVLRTLRYVGCCGPTLDGSSVADPVNRLPAPWIVRACVRAHTAS